MCVSVHVCVCVFVRLATSRSRDGAAASRSVPPDSAPVVTLYPSLATNTSRGPKAQGTLSRRIISLFPHGTRDCVTSWREETRYKSSFGVAECGGLGFWRPGGFATRSSWRPSGSGCRTNLRIQRPEVTHPRGLNGPSHQGRTKEMCSLPKLSRQGLHRIHGFGLGLAPQRVTPKYVTPSSLSLPRILAPLEKAEKHRSWVCAVHCQQREPFGPESHNLQFDVVLPASFCLNCDTHRNGVVEARCAESHASQLPPTFHNNPTVSSAILSQSPSVSAVKRA